MAATVAATLISYRVVFFSPPAVIRNRIYWIEVNWLDDRILWGLGGGITLLFFTRSVKKQKSVKKKKKKSLFSTLPVHQSTYKMLNTLCLRFKDACETHYDDTLGGWKINLSDFYIISAKEGMRLDSHFLSAACTVALCVRVSQFSSLIIFCSVSTVYPFVLLRWF